MTGIARPRLLAVSTILAAAIAGAYGLIAWTLTTSHRQAVADRHAICAAEVRTDKALREILVLARDQTLRNPAVTAEQRAEATQFYSAALRLVVEPTC